ncbi:MAG: hypothetical protein IIX48_08950 [Lachnospiraceae bacterium]|nr:hypothetical protein [Lachnospiraceae bacterium]
MKKVWYLDGKENKKKKTVKLFVYEKEKVPTAHLDLSAFAEFAQYDDWIIRFFHKDACVLKEMIYKNDSAFLKEALAGKGIMDAETAALLQRNRKDLEMCIRVGNFCFLSGGIECPLHEFDQREEKRENSDTDKNSEQTKEQKAYIKPKEPKEGQSIKESVEQIALQNRREPGRQAEQQNSREAEEQAERQNSKESERLSELQHTNESRKPIEQRLDNMRKRVTESECDSFDETDAGDEPEELQSGFRKIIELGVLEEEMLFRSYLHNSFLLHGYYNYGHLVLDERNGESRLGVPGNYYEREQMVATMFGFPDFEPAGKEEIQTGTFGYYFTKG